RRILTRPTPGGAGEARARLVVDDAFGDAEDGALDRQGGDQFAGRDAADVGLRRIVVVDHGPGLFEGLLGDEAGDQARGDAYGCEEDLHCRNLPDQAPANLSTSSAPGLTYRCELLRYIALLSDTKGHSYVQQASTSPSAPSRASWPRGVRPWSRLRLRAR